MDHRITGLSITFFSSLTATSTTFVPVAVGLGYQLGLDAIAYAMGYFKSHEMLKVGTLLTIASVLLLSLTANLLWTF